MLYEVITTFLSKLTLALLLFVVILPSGWGDDGKSSSEEAKLDIYVSGEKIGQEKFTIKHSADSIRSSSVLNFRITSYNVCYTKLLRFIFYIK